MEVIEPGGRVVDREADPAAMEGSEDLMLGVCAALQASIPVTGSARLFQARLSVCVTFTSQTRLTHHRQSLQYHR